MKRLLPLLLTGLLLTGCAGEDAPQSSKQEAIPFEEGQLYAAAHLGYQSPEDLAHFQDQYLDDAELPTYYLSDGDWYLVIPRYPDTALTLLENDMETSASAVVCEVPRCGPFLLQCNVSDIFPDATVQLTCPEGSAQFSPFISLKDGTPDIGSQGLDLTLPQ